MNKIPDKVIQFIEKTMETWRVELWAGRKNLAEVKIQRGIFQGDALSLLQLVIAMMPLNHILRKCTAGFKLCKSPEKISHLMYIDNMKLFAKKKKTKRIVNLNTDSENIQSRYRNGVWHRNMHPASNEKWETWLKELNYQIKKKSENSKKRKPTNAWEYWKLKSSNKWRWKKKIKKRVS